MVRQSRINYRSISKINYGNIKMYTLRLLFDVRGWAYYNRCVALQKNAPSDFDVSIGSNYGQAFSQKPHDMVLQLAYNYTKDLRNCLTRHDYRFPLVSSYNIGWGYSNHWLNPVIRDSDKVIINNREMWEKSGKHPKTHPISNGVDRDIFQLRKPIENRKPRILWIGSRFHRKTKNYDRILVPLEKELKKRHISCDFKVVDSVGKNRMTPEQMTYWYNTGSIYVVASSFEGTPNPALEAASCGCTVVSTRVGNMPELIKDGVNGYLCDTSMKSILEGVLKAVENQKELANNMQETIKPWDWKIKTDEYYDFFRKTIEEYKKNGYSKNKTKAKTPIEKSPSGTTKTAIPARHRQPRRTTTRVRTLRRI